MKKIMLICVFGLIISSFCWIQPVKAIELTDSTLEYAIHENDWIGYQTSMDNYGLWNYTNLDIDTITGTNENNEEYTVYTIAKVIQAEHINENFYLGTISFVNKTNQAVFSTNDATLETYWEYIAITGNKFEPSFLGFLSTTAFGLPSDISLSDVIKEEYFTDDILISGNYFFIDYFEAKEGASVIYNNESEIVIDYIDEKTVNMTYNIDLDMITYTDTIESYNLTFSKNVYVHYNEDNLCNEYTVTTQYFQNRTSTYRMLLTFYNEVSSRELLFHQKYSIWQDGMFLGILISSITAGGFIAFFIYTYFSNKKMCETSPMEVCKRYSKYTKYR